MSKKFWDATHLILKIIITLINKLTRKDEPKK